MNTPIMAGRVPEGLVTAVREARPELAHAPDSVLIRAGLAALAGLPAREAIASACRGFRGGSPLQPPQSLTPADTAT